MSWRAKIKINYNRGIYICNTMTSLHFKTYNVNNYDKLQ